MSFWGQEVPAAGAAVLLSEIDLVGAGRIRAAGTDSRGEFQFSGVPSGHYFLEVRRDDRFQGEGRVVVDVEGSLSAGHVLQARRQPAELAGVVLGRYSGEAFAEPVRIQLKPSGADEVVATIDVRAEGSFADTLPWGGYEVTLEAGGQPIVDPGFATLDLESGRVNEATLAALPVLGEGVLIDFETPRLGAGKAGRIVDPLELAGVRFTAEAAAESPFVPVAGVVRNSGTGACMPQDDDPQLLATGTGGSIGFSAFDVRVDLPGWLPAGASVAVTIQSDAMWEGEISAIDHLDVVVGSVSEPLGPGAGACVEGAISIGAARIALAAPPDVWVASVRLTVVGEGSGGRVWVADDFGVEIPGASRVKGERR